MGKSVLLRQVKAAADALPDVTTILFSAPPVDLTPERCLDTLARSLGLTLPQPLGATDLLLAFRAQYPEVQLLLLLFDEFDRYAHIPAVSASQSAGRRFFNDLEAARRDLPGIGIAAAGSIGIFVFRDILGSSFLARAEQFRLSPFDRSQLRDLASPFADHGRPLGEDALDALHLASGGNPALATFGLQELWDDRDSAPTEHRVMEIFTGFRERHREFLRDIEQSFSDPALSQAPQRVLDLVKRSGGTISRLDLQEACRAVDGSLRLDFIDVLHLLSASGLVQVEGSLVTDDPVSVRPVTSILSLPQVSLSRGGLRERFLYDLAHLLERLHAASADFFRSGGPGEEKKLLPEAVFACFLDLGLGLLGWLVEREAQQAAGRTDLKVRRGSSSETAVVEVKIWGRNDYQDVHRQIESYWTVGTVAGAVVMITDREIPDWPGSYRSQCLNPHDVLPITKTSPGSPIRAQLSYTSTTPDGMTAYLDHFLLRLPRR